MLITTPIRISLEAILVPTNLDKYYVPQKAGIRPRLISGRAKLACSEHRIISLKVL